MAKIVEDILVVKFSKIVKDSEDDSQALCTEEIQAALEQVAQELAGPGLIVEVTGAQ